MSSVASGQFDQVETAVRDALARVNIPDELQNALVEAVSTMVTGYLANKLRPSELNAGDFTEACVRVLQFLDKGSYTKLGSTLPRMDLFLNQIINANIDDSLRLHVPRLLQTIYDVRNRRGVGHLAGSVSPNRPDAELLMTSVRWILAEFVRLFTGTTDHIAAQRTVDLLAVHMPQLVEDFEGAKRIISDVALSVPQQVLVLTFASGGVVTTEHLSESIKATSSAISVAIKRLDTRSQIHIYKDKRVQLTSLGKVEAGNIIESVRSS